MAASIEIIEILVSDDSFCKYVLNPDPQNLKYWDAYRLDNLDKSEDIEQAIQIVLLLGKNKSGITSDERIAAIWHRLQDSIGEGPNSSINNSTVDLRHYSHVLLKLAVAVIFLVGIAYMFKGTPEGVNKNGSNVVNYFNRNTPLGQKATFYLPDGSQVMLNSGSSIEYHECEECHTRELVLEGEAYLNIKEDASRPFTVITKNLATTVLGTSFNVRAYKDDAQIEVALITGKVSITNKDKSQDVPLILYPNEMVLYSNLTEVPDKVLFESDHVLGWTNKILVFEDVNFNQLTTELSRWYGVKFILQDSTKRKNSFMNRQDYKGKYRNKSLETVLEAVSFSYGFDFEIKGKTVLIK